MNLLNRFQWSLKKKKQTSKLIQKILNALGVNYDFFEDEEYFSGKDNLVTIFSFITNENLPDDQQDSAIHIYKRDSELVVMLYKEGDHIGYPIKDGQELIEIFKKFNWIDSSKYLKQINNTQNVKTFETWSISPDGLEIPNNDDMSIEYTHADSEHYFKEIKKKWGIKDGRQTTTYGYQYNFPIEAKEDLDDFGITWYKKERVTNSDHPDYGKEYLTFNWIHKDLSQKS